MASIELRKLSVCFMAVIIAEKDVPLLVRAAWPLSKWETWALRRDGCNCVS